jgi:hypothetical protein
LRDRQPSADLGSNRQILAITLAGDGNDLAVEAAAEQVEERAMQRDLARKACQSLAVVGYKGSPIAVEHVWIEGELLKLQAQAVRFCDLDQRR